MLLQKRHILFVLAITGLLAVPASSVFTGFDKNPAAGALDLEDNTMFDSNPAAQAQNAVPQHTRRRPRVQQRSEVSANATTRSEGNVDAQQNTQTGINDHLNYRTQQNHGNIYLDQDAVSRIVQDCQVDGTCKQNASSDIRQGADIRIDGRFTNVFLSQDAKSYIQQHCEAGERCLQGTDSNIQQDADFENHWSSNGFVTRDQRHVVERDHWIR